MKIIGLLPASGEASRMNGLPKFALPCDKNNRSLLEKHVDELRFYSDTIIISTTHRWYNLVESFGMQNVEIERIEPSTMNDAIITMAEKYEADKYIVGMPDTYFKGENPYVTLSESIKKSLVSVACWPMNDKLKGKVGQVNLVNNSILDIIEKVDNCNYKHLWGAVAFDGETLKKLNRQNSHVGIDLKDMTIDMIKDIYAFEVDGEYFDAGTIYGYRDLLNSI